MAVKKASEILAGLHIVPEGKNFTVYNGDKPLLTPAQKPYCLPSAALAGAIVAEWRAQTDKIVPPTMPLTQLAATAIDLVAKDRERIVQQVLAHAATELLCHRTDKPESLAARQQEVWQPLLEWCALRFGAMLCPVQGVMPLAQKPDAISALHKAIEAYGDFVLTGLSHAVDVSGSLVLGLALTEKERSADEIFEAAELDTGFQAAKWGIDPVTEARFNSVRRDLDVCERWFGLLGSS
ncbi:MAG: ATPase [Alphaproteobacteria bacterium]|nr:ATPase [Alphaproteobacteria bacterium]